MIERQSKDGAAQAKSMRRGLNEGKKSLRYKHSQFPPEAILNPNAMTYAAQKIRKLKE